MSTRRNFDEELRDVKEDIIRMGGVVEEMLAGSAQALQGRNSQLAKNVIAMDDIVDNYNFDIEQKCLSLLALQQPMARDLRTIAAALYIIKDVERMGDYAFDIAQVAEKLTGMESLKPAVSVSPMADIVRGMLHKSLRAFVDHDMAALEDVIRSDDKVDAMYREVHDSVIAMINDNPAIAQCGVELILVVRYLERTADHITNVCERIAYIETGEIRELH